MIRAVCGADGRPILESSVQGIGVYLDTFAVKTLAKGDPGLRKRFIGALHNGADLLFSIGNGAEMCAAQGDSAIAIKTLLDELGPHWYPVEVNPHAVMERESAGLDPSECCLTKELLRAYFENRTADYVSGSLKVIDLSEQFFRLGFFLDCLVPQRDNMLEHSRRFDAILLESVEKMREKHKRNPGWLDYVIPVPQFNPRMPATFSFNCLMRQLVADTGFQMKKGDGMDFCHAVMGSAFAVFATLDKHWKRRVENFPKPNRAARIYYEPELDKMIGDIENAIGQLKNLSAVSGRG